ncbi:MAG TPA: ABC transporter ATP-binding protein [Candidatus Latescibacteria bacterium]|nr:ABC transporter ATP-binding protein [Candidatus Latescibacterota bacterium]
MFGPFSEYVRPYRRRILLAVAVIACAQVAATLIPLQIGAAVDSLAEDSTEALSLVRDRVINVLALALCIAMGGYFMRRLTGVTSTWIEYDIRTKFFAHLLAQPLSFYQEHRTGDLMARATNDLTQVRIFFTYGLRGIAETALIFLFSVTMMCRIDWQLTLLVLIPLPLMSLFLVRMAAIVHTRFRAIQDFFGDISNFIQENLAGIRVVKAYVQGPAQSRHFAGLNQEYLERNASLIHTHAVYRPLSFLIASIGLGMNLWLGGKGVVAGSLSIGDFVALNAYLTLLIRPVSYVGWVIDRSQRALVAIRRINEVLAIEPQISDRTLPATTSLPEQISGRLQFDNVGFAYDGIPALHSLNLDLPAGTTLGIIGRVGAGKTTFARLIPRLIEPTQGRILLDGVPLDQWPLTRLRQAIGYVAQTPFLFSDTMGANIGYGVEDASEPQIHEAAEEAQVRTDIESFEEGFATVIGERGVTLSGGQKQRTTLARALLRRPEILILDDSLSAVDTHTEEAILGHLRRIMAERTTILIAHRISTLRDADHIIVLDEGGIAEEGTHGELVASQGIYAGLARRQQLAEELEVM